jgi:hypothetical protein
MDATTTHSGRTNRTQELVDVTMHFVKLALPDGKPTRRLHCRSFWIVQIDVHTMRNVLISNYR